MPAVVTRSNPPAVRAPTGYTHAIQISGEGRRLVISGQVGVALDGTVPSTGEGQVTQAFANLRAVLTANGMTVENIVKTTVFLTDRGLLSTFRSARGAVFGAILIANQEKTIVVKDASSDVDFSKSSKGFYKFVTRKKLRDELLHDGKLVVEIAIEESTMERILRRTQLAKDMDDWRHLPHSDFIIQIGDQQLNVLKVVLSVRSKFFKSMFDSECAEVQNGVVRISISIRK